MRARVLAVVDNGFASGAHYPLQVAFFSAVQQVAETGRFPLHNALDDLAKEEVFHSSSGLTVE